MKKWKFITGIVLIFFLGALIGSLGTGLFLKYQFSGHRKPETAKMTVMKRLVRQLDLTADQKPRIEAIVDQIQTQTRDHFRKTREEMKGIIAQGIARIKKELNPDQQKKLDELHERFKRRHKR
ncbi:MAG: hypothetical protein PHP23_09695 [Desulfobacterales bacterium]|nr:hypothetical protein [Desulfobacterales bacterium]MDD4073027.1 hypothetical protein [Desulfobacterales bacterium]MDD4392823.1 hypothetical protein [Desulfobacterales bacterium]